LSKNFVSYAAGAVRLSALSKHQVIWVGESHLLFHFNNPRPLTRAFIATHDSIGLGEDGPTHQPIETAIHLRSIPNLAFWRPADGNETSASYLVALQSTSTPSVISLSRQNLPNLAGSTIERASRGGYVLCEEEEEDLTIVSSGSEVCIAVEAAEKLKAQGIKTRIVSLPCWLVFDQQEEEYRLGVLRSGAPILSLEALSVSSSMRYYGTSTYFNSRLRRLRAGPSIAMRFVLSPHHSRTVVEDAPAIRFIHLGRVRTVQASV
jgi:transketolase